MYTGYLSICPSLQVATLSGHSEKVMLLLQFGQHILSIGAEGRLLVWPACGSESGAQVEPVGELLFRNTFTPTCLMHPDTYLNKVSFSALQFLLLLLLVV